ncbi:hypothetical protein CEE45_01980 [Candidatus Heimdallarchaeota archaeon B3_Heim]|nr:MAG: hypothetical protein CEE45_01980 [Candidatus Heimdallarchaeota archaeon B3_Heim]
MSKNKLQVSIHSLILSLFPIHPKAINEQIYTQVISEVQNLWKSYESKLRSQIQSLSLNKIDQEAKIKTHMYENLLKNLETLQEARKNHFKTGSLPSHWWPDPNDIYLSNRVPAYSHTFRFQDNTIYFTLEETFSGRGMDKSARKKLYLLSEIPVKQYSSIIQISFQFRSLTDEEITEFGRQPKQESINNAIQKTLRKSLRKFSILVDVNSNHFIEALSFHISLFAQENDPLILHKHLFDYYTDLINKLWRIDSGNLSQVNFLSKIEKEKDDFLLRKTNSWFLLKLAKLLATFEDLLISIWSKKSLVSQTEYVITLGKLAEWTGSGFVEEISDSIVSNEKQIKEWVDLYKIDPITVKEQLRDPELRKLFPIDTGYFNTDFKWKLLNALPDIPIHDLLDGYIYRSDNWYALNSLQKIWCGKIKCIYIDPPYNTGNDDFLYKDNFDRYEWMVMMRNRLELAKTYLTDDGVIITSIDDNEMSNLKLLLDEIFDNNSIGPIIVQTNPRGRTLDKHLAKTHEYLLIYALNKDHTNTLFKIPKNENQLAEYNKVDDCGRSYRLIELRNRNPRFNRTNRPNLYYPIYTNQNTFQISLTQSAEFPIEILPKTSRNVDDCWTWSKEKTLTNQDLLVSKKVATGAWRVFRKNYLDKRGESSTTKEKSMWIEGSLSNERGREQLRDLFGLHTHDYPKSVNYIERIVQLATDDNQVIMDFFAGSGTTAQAVMQLNRKNQTKKKFVLIEKSNQFKNVILPRIKKLSFSYQWKDGSPRDKSSQGVFVQYQVLEQPMEEVFTRINLKKFLSKKGLKYNLTDLKFQVAGEIPLNPFNDISELEEGEILQITGISYIYTCNQLLGLNPSFIRCKSHNGINYLFIFGIIDEQRTLVVWRNTENLNLEIDRRILEELMANTQSSHVFINDSCLLEHYSQLDSLFKLMI